MTSPSSSLVARAATLACMLMACGWVADARAQNLVTNGSFETGTWEGTASFVDPNTATDVFYPAAAYTGWRTFGNTPWVEDSLRAEDGNRMVWLTPVYFINQYVSPSGLQAGETYHLTIAYDFFDPLDLDGGMNSSIDIHVETGWFMGTMEMPDTFIADFTDSGMTDNWANGGAMNWKTFSVDFTMPSLVGMDYLNIFIQAPSNSPSTPSMGVLVDNVSLSLAVIPEPGSLLLVALGCVLGCRRRRP